VEPFARSRSPPAQSTERTYRDGVALCRPDWPRKRENGTPEWASGRRKRAAACERLPFGPEGAQTAEVNGDELVDQLSCCS
jgi:hypothetical protein